MQLNRVRAIGLVAVGAAIAVVGTVFTLRGNKPAATVTRGDGSSGTAAVGETSGDGLPRTVTADGKTYTLRDDVTTVLFMGVDVNSDYVPDGSLLTVGTGGRSDALMLAILYDNDHTASLLQISRDSIVSVDVYSSKTDKFLYRADMQITMQYAMGGSDRRSSWLTKNKVGELLNGLNIDYGISLKMDGMPALVEALGGIRITMPEDYTVIDPAFVQGETVLLDGAQAYRFARYRDTDCSGSNDDRMSRQQLLLGAVLEQMASAEQESYEHIIKAAEPYMYSDVDAETMQSLSRYTFGGSSKVPGETVLSEDGLHDEYIVDYAGLDSLILQLFYTEA